jgi:hypothetical protein
MRQEQITSTDHHSHLTVRPQTDFSNLTPERNLWNSQQRQMPTRRDGIAGFHKHLLNFQLALASY